MAIFVRPAVRKRTEIGLLQSSGIYTLAFSMTPMDEGEGARAANVETPSP